MQSSSASAAGSSSNPLGSRFFGHLDQQGGIRNQKIYWDDFVPYLNQNGWNPTEAQQVWWEVDTGRSGALSRDEFIRFASLEKSKPYMTRMEQSLQGNMRQGQGFSGQAQQGFSAQAHGQAQGQEQQRLALAEEKLLVGKTVEQAGQVELGKRVETQHVQQTVPVKHEEFFIERRPVADGRSGQIETNGSTIRVPLMREEVVVEKKPVVREEVVIGKRVVEEQQTVGANLAREHLEVRENQAAAAGISNMQQTQQTQQTQSTQPAPVGTIGNQQKCCGVQQQGLKSGV